MKQFKQTQAIEKVRKESRTNMVKRAAFKYMESDEFKEFAKNPTGKSKAQTYTAKDVVNLEGDYHLHLSSLEPENIDDKFIQLFNHPKMIKHLHLCLQSGNEKILLSMRRQYSKKQFSQILNDLKSINPLLNFTTDIIVGFPGEGEKEFQDSIDALEELQFSHIHTFPFSKRTGTRAETMPNQVDEKVKKERGEIIREYSLKTRRNYLNKFINTTQKVLVEKIANNTAYGYSEYYIPVEFPYDKQFSNIFVNVKITGIYESKDLHLKGEII